MNIDKKQMDILVSKRNDPDKMRELLKNLYEMSSQIAHHFDIPYNKRDDYIQSAVIRSWMKLDKYDPKRNSHAFSYFYQTIRRDMMNNMRKEKKRDSIASFISSDDSRNSWIKNIKQFDPNYQKIEDDRLVLGPDFEVIAVKKDNKIIHIGRKRARLYDR